MAETVQIPKHVWDEVGEVMNLMRRPAFPDPHYHEYVKTLGEQIGFGVLMSTAEAGWRERLKERGDPAGSEFVSGPCRGTVDRLIAMIDEVNASLSKGDSG